MTSRTPSGPCARHGCGHDAGAHRVFDEVERRWVPGPCNHCAACADWLEEPACKRIAPIVVTAASGTRYTKCACGVVRVERAEAKSG